MIGWSVNNELERVQMEVVVALFWYLPGETEGNHEKKQW
jgi:hypothetical protein